MIASFVSSILFTLFVVSSCSVADSYTPLAMMGEMKDLHGQTIHHDNDSSVEDRCALACTNLQQNNPSITVSYANTTAFTTLQSSYFSSFQSSVSPHCFIEPTSAQDVSAILHAIKSAQCPFAVKSGGHACFKGASNAPGGITISLNKMKGFEVVASEDGKIARMGTGNLWGEVYDAVGKEGVMVVGGRLSSIGVGGLTLGGGISFFSGRRGWACDNVRNYELVTAEGEILQVDRKSHPDLYWALRGGGNQFGIVTRLDLEAFEQGDMWGGGRAMKLWENEDALLDAFYNFVHTGTEKDPDASMWLGMAYLAPPNDTWLAAPYFAHANGNGHLPDVFDEFLNIPFLEGSSTLRVASMAALAKESQEKIVNGLRESYWTRTFLLSREMMEEIVRIWKKEVEEITKQNVEGLTLPLVFQYISIPILQHMSRDGGNALGLDTSRGPLLMMNMPAQWSDTDERKGVLVIEALRRIVDRCAERSRELGVGHEFVYMNYAAKGQRVFEGYGGGNLGRLRGLQGVWDPEGVVRRLQGGYFGVWE